MTLKVVYNGCYGGFSLSQQAVDWLHKRGLASANIYDNIPRHHPLLVECVETLGAKADGRYASLRVASLQIWKYRIDEYDGAENVVVPNEDEWTYVDPEDLEELSRKCLDSRPKRTRKTKKSKV